MFEFCLGACRVGVLCFGQFIKVVLGNGNSVSWLGMVIPYFGKVANDGHGTIVVIRY